MGDEKKKKYLSIFISVVIAVGLWFYVINGENPTQTKTYTGIPIEILNQNTLTGRDLTISNMDTGMITVKIEGKRGILRSIDKEDIIASIDVANYKRGDYYAEVSVHAPSSVRVIEISPAQIRLTIEPVVSEDREVDVLFKGEVPQQKEAACTEISTQLVSVSGAKSVVNRVEKLVASIDAASLSSSAKSFTAPLTPVDSAGAIVEGIKVSIKEIALKAQLYTVKTVSLKVPTVGVLPEGLELASITAPDTIQIAGVDSEVRKITEVSTVPVNLSEITASQHIDIVLDISGNIRMARSQKKVRAEITVRKIDNQPLSYDVSSIAVKGLAEGYELSFDEQSVSMKVTGTDIALKEISTQDFSLSIDCTGLGKGTHKVKLDVEQSKQSADSGISAERPEVTVRIV